MVEAVEALGNICGPSANHFIERWFGDCVYSTLETFGFCIGLSSVFFWLIAQLPQIISNILRQSAEALSLWLLFQWLAGDFCNLLGCILTGDQLATQTITAGYFIFSDCIILTQYFYYQKRNGVYYSDSDKSLHKLSNGYEGVMIASNLELDKLCERSAIGKILQDSEVEDEPRAEVTSPSNISRADREHACHLPQIFYPFSVSDFDYRNGLVHEQRHRSSGLEYGQETVSRLNLPYTKEHKGRNVNYPMLVRRGSDQVPGPSRKVKFKALLGAACLFGLAFSNRYMVPSSSPSMDHNFGSVLGRRTLLAVPGTTAVSFKENLSKLCTILGLTQTSSQLILGSHPTIFWTKVIGRTLGWVSSILYLGSRFSQIAKNKRRRSADGLSLEMFACAVLGNLTYGTSIFIRASSWESLIGMGPWLIGSLGTVFLDCSIFIQAHYYRWHSKKGVPTSEYTPLLA